MQNRVNQETSVKFHLMWMLLEDAGFSPKKCFSVYDLRDPWIELHLRAFRVQVDPDPAGIITTIFKVLIDPIAADAPADSYIRVLSDCHLNESFLYDLSDPSSIQQILEKIRDLIEKTRKKAISNNGS